MSAPDFGRRVVVGKIGGTPRLKAEDELSKEGGKIEDIVIVGEQIWVRVMQSLAFAVHGRETFCRHSRRKRPTCGA